MDTVRIAIIGVGNIGSHHAKNISDGKVEGLCLVALCDSCPLVQERLGEQYPEIPIYTDCEEVFAKEKLDSVLIATPHYFHPDIAINAFNAGLHVLTEKPAGVYTKQVMEMNQVAEDSGKIFGIMFNQRTNMLFAKAREIIKSGELGIPKRLVWIVTNWYRTQFYYDSGGWRGSYGGEGGGVLINQAPHNLDLLQWIFGMPETVTAFLGIGRYHNINVEDEANIFMTYESGATATFMTSTGEPCGTNRLEITADKGKMVLEDGKLKIWRLAESEREFCFSEKTEFYQSKSEYEEILQTGEDTAHIGIIQNFTNAILYGEPLLAPGDEGISSLMISNAAYLSHWKGETVTLPFDEDEFYHILKSKSNDYATAESKMELSKNTTNDASTRWQVRW